MSDICNHSVILNTWFIYVVFQRNFLTNRLLCGVTYVRKFTVKTLCLHSNINIINVVITKKLITLIMFTINDS